jgi:predicted nucleic acid-binding protein
MPGSFFDSNVLIYAVSGDLVKADRAQELITAGGTISVQVLNEIANVAIRKIGFSWDETRRFLFRIQGALPVVALTVETHERGLYLAERYRLSIYDGMIASAALGSDCDILWSEDMQHGLLIDSRLTVVNPFRLAS